MSAATATADALHFSQSTSRMTGVNGRAVEYMREHADHLSGRSSIVGDGLFTASALSPVLATGIGPDPISMATAGAMLASRLPLAFSDQSQVAEVTPENVGERPKNWTDRVKRGVGKATDPKHHPVETAAALSLLAGIFFFATGANGMFGLLSDEAVIKEASESAIGYMGKVAISAMNLLLGTLMIGARSMEVFGTTPEERKAWEQKEAEENPSLTFANSTHKEMGFHGKKGGIVEFVQNNPEMISGAVGMAGSALMIGIGILQTMAGQPGGALYAISGAVYLASTLLYSLFVRRDHSKDKAEDPAQSHAEKVASARPSGSFTERLASQAQEQATPQQPAFSMA